MEPLGPPTILGPQGTSLRGNMHGSQGLGISQAMESLHQPMEPLGPPTILGQQAARGSLGISLRGNTRGVARHQPAQQAQLHQARQGQAASTATKGSLGISLRRNIRISQGLAGGAANAVAAGASPRTQQAQLWQARLQGLSMALNSKWSRFAAEQALEQAQVQAEEQAQERHRCAALIWAEVASVCVDKLEAAEASEQAQRPAQAQQQTRAVLMVEELARCALLHGSEELEVTQTVSYKTRQDKKRQDKSRLVSSRQSLLTSWRLRRSRRPLATRRKRGGYQADSQVYPWTPPDPPSDSGSDTLLSHSNGVHNLRRSGGLHSLEILPRRDLTTGTGAASCGSGGLHPAAW